MLDSQKLKNSIMSLVDLKCAPLQGSTWHFWPGEQHGSSTQQRSLTILRFVLQLPNNESGVEFKTSPHPHAVGVLEC